MSQELINILSDYFSNQPVDKAWLFGSFARHEDDYQSDIDVMVHFSPEKSITLFNYIHIVNDLEALTGRNIDLVEDGQIKEFARNSVENDKILIYERKTKRS